MTIVGGVVQPDYDACVDGPVGDTIIVEGPPGPTGPTGPQGPPGGSSGCPLFCGTGSPEGVVTSPIGGMYEQTDAASTSHAMWVKHSGVGNTGWRQWAGLRGGDGTNTAIRIGDLSIASGTDSVAIGEAAEATGASAIAIGKNTLASGARSEAYGQDSEATADDAKAYGAGAIASAASALAFGVGALAAGINAIAVGPAARVDGNNGIAIGDGRARDVSDIIIGFGNDIGQALAHSNIVIGKTATIGTTADSSSPTASARGGHVVIGELASAGMGPSAFPNTIIGREASSVGRAVICIGQNAQARAADTPVTGKTEGRFATIIGYLAKGSGGCIVSVGDQVDVRGDSTVAVGTHARANDNNATAIGPNAWAGSLTTDNTGTGAVAVGPATATGKNSVAIGNGANATKEGAIAIGVAAEATLPGAIAIGSGVVATQVKALTFGSVSSPIYAIHFNDSDNPAILVTQDGKISLVNAGASAVQQPFTGNATLTVNEPTAYVNATGGAITITLPPSTGSGQIFVVLRTNSNANNVTVLAQGGDIIDIEADADYVLDAQYDFVILVDDGTPGAEWFGVDWT